MPLNAFSSLVGAGVNSLAVVVPLRQFRNALSLEARESVHEEFESLLPLEHVSC